jgi:hypothetical protein
LAQPPPRRERFFAENAEFFARLDSFLYCHKRTTPISAASQDGALTRIAAHAAGHSKMFLNIHQGNIGYFEWHRMVRLGMCSGSVVISDVCLSNPLFKANEHYLEAELAHLPELIEFLLSGDEGTREARRIRANADHLIDAYGEDTTHVEALIEFLDRHHQR